MRTWPKAVLLALLLAAIVGCGTTKWSDTARTATEQLLISDAIDRSVSDFDFSALAGKSVFFDNTYLKGSVDENYVVSSLRQHLLASGCYLMETREAADYVVEARAGAVGTDRSDLLFGVPSVNVPTVPGLPMAVPSTIPEIPLAKTTNQKAVAKLAVFAYNRRTGRPVFQTGVDPAISTARNSWLFGAGPFRRGTIYDHHQVLDGGVDIPIIGGREQANDLAKRSLPVTAEAIFAESAIESSAPPESEPTEAQVATGQAGATSSDSTTAPNLGGGTRPATVAAAQSPGSADAQVARLPAVDRSGINSSTGAPAAAANLGVQRAQFVEPIAPSAVPPSPASSSMPATAVTRGETSTAPNSRSIWRPSTWFGKAKD
jgi:hypothetical protein